MKLTTSKGKTFDVLWMDVMNRNSDQLVISLEDDRPMGEIIQDFDGLESITAVNDRGWTKTVEGYSVVTGATRRSDGHVLITMSKPKI